MCTIYPVVDQSVHTYWPRQIYIVECLVDPTSARRISTWVGRQHLHTMFWEWKKTTDCEKFLEIGINISPPNSIMWGLLLTGCHRHRQNITLTFLHRLRLLWLYLSGFKSAVQNGHFKHSSRSQDSTVIDNLKRFLNFSAQAGLSLRLGTQLVT